MLLFPLQIFFKNRILDEEGFVLFVRKNALQVLIPKYGLEGTVFLDQGEKKLGEFNEEVGPAVLHSSLFIYCIILLRNFRSMFVSVIQENSQTFGDVVIRMFDPVTVQVSIDSSNIQHQKLVLKLVHPKVM